MNAFLTIKDKLNDLQFIDIVRGEVMERKGVGLFYL